VAAPSSSAADGLAPDLYLVRHGETAWSLTGQHTGLTDLPLLPEGEDEARRLAPVLGDVGFVTAWSSDRRRALRTAELAGIERPAVTPLLRELDYGDYEGLTSDEIHRDRPGWQLFADGCPGGESPDGVLARARAFLAELEGIEGAAVAFSHGHFLRVVAVAWLGLDIGAAAHLALDTASVSVLHDGAGGRLVRRWNWTLAL
jgi:broad specificity phosphatase PhoE